MTIPTPSTMKSVTPNSTSRNRFTERNRLTHPMKAKFTNFLNKQQLRPMLLRLAFLALTIVPTMGTGKRLIERLLREEKRSHDMAVAAFTSPAHTHRRLCQAENNPPGIQLVDVSEAVAKRKMCRAIVENAITGDKGVRKMDKFTKPFVRKTLKQFKQDAEFANSTKDVNSLTMAADRKGLTPSKGRPGLEKMIQEFRDARTILRRAKREHIESVFSFFDWYDDVWMPQQPDGRCSGKDKKEKLPRKMHRGTKMLLLKCLLGKDNPNVRLDFVTGDVLTSFLFQHEKFYAMAETDDADEDSGRTDFLVEEMITKYGVKFTIPTSPRKFEYRKKCLDNCRCEEAGNRYPDRETRKGKYELSDIILKGKKKKSKKIKDSLTECKIFVSGVERLVHIDHIDNVVVSPV